MSNRSSVWRPFAERFLLVAARFCLSVSHALIAILARAGNHDLDGRREQSEARDAAVGRRDAYTRRDHHRNHWASVRSAGSAGLAPMVVRALVLVRVSDDVP